MPALRAASERASVVGPGTGSARSNVAGSSRWQKYWERKSSGRQTTSAPFRAASSTRSTALARFASESAEQDICTSAIRKFLPAVIVESVASQDSSYHGNLGGSAERRR